MRRTALESGTATDENGYAVTAIAVSHDQDLGPASASNRASLQLDVRLPNGGTVVLHFAGAEAAKLVRPVATAAVVEETMGDTARRYLRDFANNHLTPHQIAELNRISAEDPIPNAG